MPRRLLIVDDEDDIREVAQLSLEMTVGWEILLASSGQEALEIAEREQPDAILLDVMMPEMDGPTTFRSLQAKQSTRDIPVVLLTAKVHPSDKRMLSDLGVVGILAKPFDPMQLAADVAEVLGWNE